ncbi:MAG: fused MFS/spermidine synthase [Acidobacteriota bacterium]|nr:MAG: fused MFS/spermidine synthase [Acidobacteriota bacterium]
MTRVDPGQRRRRGALAVLFFAAGGLALTVQVTLLRELIVDLQGDETAVALGLAAWLAGIAAGAWVARRLASERPTSWAVGGFLLLAVGGPLEVLAGRLGRWVLAPPPGELLSLGPALVLALIVLAPAGFLVGLTFTALAACAPLRGFRAGEGLAWLYVLESLGSLAGGLLVTWLFVPLLSPLSGILLACGLWLFVGSAAARARLVPGRRALPIAALVFVTLALPWSADRLERSTVEIRFRALAAGIPLLAWTDTRYQHLVIGGGELRHLYAGGQYAGSFPDPTEYETLAHRLASLAARPRRVLLVGSGSEGLLRFLLDHPVERIDLVQIDRRALDLVRAYLPPADERTLADPRVRIIEDDPRRFLQRASGEYDLMLILEPAPVTLLLARLSTVEFYELCAARLAPEGAVVVRLETAPNVLTGETAALGGSVWGALRDVFPVVEASPGPDSLLLAGFDASVVTLDPDTLAARFEQRGLASRVFVPQLFPILFPPQRVTAQRSALDEAARRYPPSRDERPVSFLHALSLRQQIAGSRIAPLLGTIARVPGSWLLAAAMIPSLILLLRITLRRRAASVVGLAATHAVLVTGGCGMAWSLLILFSYQTRVGALYGQIGLLAALFMLGLAGGGAALSRAAELAPETARRALLVCTAAALSFALVLAATLRWDAAGSIALLARPGLAAWAYGALLFLAGLVTGALFPVAAGVLRGTDREIRHVAGRLETADHLGAAIAALLAGVVLIPALGTSGVAWLLAGLEAIALAGALVAGLRTRRAT